MLCNRSRSRHALPVTPTDGPSAYQVHLRTRGTAAASQECCRLRFPTLAAIIHAQVHQMPRSDRARRSTTQSHDSTAVQVCMARRLVDNSDALCLHGGLLYDQALLKALARHHARYRVLLAVSAAGCVLAAWPAARERPARAWDARRPRYCMGVCVACVRVFCGAEAASACGYS